MRTVCSAGHLRNSQQQKKKRKKEKSLPNKSMWVTEERINRTVFCKCSWCDDRTAGGLVKEFSMEGKNLKLNNRVCREEKRLWTETDSVVTYIKQVCYLFWCYSKYPYVSSLSSNRCVLLVLTCCSLYYVWSVSQAHEVKLVETPGLLVSRLHRVLPPLVNHLISWVSICNYTEHVWVWPLALHGTS